MMVAPYIINQSSGTRLYGVDVTYDSATGFWESPSNFATDGTSLNPNVLHDYTVFGKLVFIGTPGTYPTGYDPDLFYYAFYYVHYVPNPTSFAAPTNTFRFGLALTPEDGMNRIPVIFADRGTGLLRFDAAGKFIKLVTTVPECCDLPYFNEQNLLLQNYEFSFDPELLNVYNTLYDNSVALHNQIGHDKVKKNVSFTISGITRNGIASPTDPAGLDAQINQVIGWMNTAHTMYHHSDSPEISFYNNDELSRAGHSQQYKSGVLLGNGSLSYHNARMQTGPSHYLVSRFTVTYGNLIGPFPTYTPDPDKILYRLTVTGQFHYNGPYVNPRLFSLVYELKESCTLITLGHLSGTKTLTLVAETDPYINYYISGIPGTIDVAFSGSDYSAEVLPATLTLVSPEKYLQDPCRMAGSMNGLGNYSYPFGLSLPVDGITPVEGDRVYITTTTGIFARGVWIASAGYWTRPTDWNLKYSYFEILEGTNAGKKYYLTESTGYVFSQFRVSPSQHGWTVNNYTDELPSTITLNKVAGYNNYEAEFTTAFNVRNYIRVKLNSYGSNVFTFQQWTQEISYGAGTGYYQPSDALIEYFNESNGLTDGSLLYTAPATVKMLSSCSGLITIRLFKMAATNNGSSLASENSLTVQYLLDWPLDIGTPPPS